MRFDTSALLAPQDNALNIFNIAYNSNALGTIVSVAGLPSDPNPHAVIFNPFFDLGNFGTDNSFAYDINSNQDVVGTAATASGPSHAFMHLGPSILDQSTDDLGTLGGLNSEATCINNFQQVAGWSDLACPAGTPIRHAFLWQNGKMQDLGTPFLTLPITIKDQNGKKRTVRRVSTFTRLRGTSDRQGGEYMNGLVVNETPQPEIVGYSELYYGTAMQVKGLPPNCTGTLKSFKRAFLFDGTTMRDLNKLIPAKSGWYLQMAFGINNSGQIVGQGLIKGEQHAFLLLPK